MKRTFRFNADGELVEVGEKTHEVWFIHPNWRPITEMPEHFWYHHRMMQLFAEGLTGAGTQ